MNGSGVNTPQITNQSSNNINNNSNTIHSISHQSSTMSHSTITSMNLSATSNSPSLLNVPSPNSNNTTNNSNSHDDKNNLNHLNQNSSNPNKKSKGGSSCHQCKSRRNFTALTYCTSNLDKKNKRCRKKFCGHCLKKFYKENPAHIPDRNNWKCPSCRKICCCAACRRRKGKDNGSALYSLSGKSDDISGSNTNSTTKSTFNGTNSKNGSNSAGYSLYPDDSSNSYTPMTDDPSYTSMNPTSSNPNSHGASDDYINPFMPYSPLNLPDEMQLQAFRDLDDTMDSNDNSGSGNDSDGDGDGDDSLSSPNTFSSSQFSTVLAAHIRTMAEEAKKNQNTPFARIWKGCQEASVRKKIRTILQRPDTKKDKKVDMLAALLVHLQ